MTLSSLALGLPARYLSAILIGLGSNLDNTGVGIAYGMDRLRFPRRINLLVNVIGFVAALLGAVTGRFVGSHLGTHVAAAASCAVLVGLGTVYLYASRRHFQRGGAAKTSFGRRLGPPGWRTGILLGFALSATNLASGFGATVSRGSLFWPAVVSITLFGYLAIWLGNLIGLDVLAGWLGRYAALVGGCVLVAVGVHQIM
jgi:putative Mn2+ efflux pump MntP